MLGWFGRKMGEGLTPVVSTGVEYLEQQRISAQVAMRELRDRTEYAVRLLAFAMAGATGLATGFIAALGFEAFPFLDKWTVLGAIVFYALVCTALLTPLLALPNSAAELRRYLGRRARGGREMSALDIYREIKAVEEALEGLAREKSSLDRALAGAVAGAASHGERLKAARAELEVLKAKPLDERTISAMLTRSRSPKERRDDEIAEQVQRIEQLERETAEGIRVRLADATLAVDDLNAQLNALRAEKHAVVTRGALKRAEVGLGFVGNLSILVYLCGLFVVLMNVLEWQTGLAIAASVTLLLAIARYLSLLVVSPLLTAVLFITGYALGEQTLALDPSTMLEVGNQKMPVQVLFYTPDSVIALGRPNVGSGDASKRVMVIPRERVGIAVLPPSRGIKPWEWIMSLKPFVWIARPRAADANSLAAPHRNS